LHNNEPDPAVTTAAAAPGGTLTVSRGKVGLFLFFFPFFLLMGGAGVSVEGTAEPICVMVFCRRVRGAMLVWQDDSWGKTQEGQ